MLMAIKDRFRNYNLREVQEDFVDEFYGDGIVRT